MGSACESSLEPEVYGVERLVEDKVLKSSKCEVSLHPPYFWRRMVLRSVGQWIRTNIMWHQMGYDQILSLARDGVANQIILVNMDYPSLVNWKNTVFQDLRRYSHQKPQGTGQGKLLLFSSTEEMGDLWGVILCSSHIQQIQGLHDRLQTGCFKQKPFQITCNTLAVVLLSKAESSAFLSWPPAKTGIFSCNSDEWPDSCPSWL